MDERPMTSEPDNRDDYTPDAGPLAHRAAVPYDAGRHGYLRVAWIPWLDPGPLGREVDAALAR